MAQIEIAACPDRLDLLAFRLRSLSGESRFAVARHLRVCSHCRMLAAGEPNEAPTGPATSVSLQTLTIPALAPTPSRQFESESDNPRPQSEPSANQTAEGGSAPTCEVPGARREPPRFLRPPQLPGELGRLGPFRVLELLGEGGMGMVFRAVDPTLDRPVALKVLKPQIAESPNARDRFLREARAMAGIDSDHVVNVHQIGEDDGVPYMAMQLLEGRSVYDWIESAEDRFLSEILRVAREICEGLAAVHELGLVHRDIKPANIWIDRIGGRVRILDFGLVQHERELDDRLTQVGMVMGTPDYMSPEQAEGGDVDGRSDLFSLGGLLYLLCTGRMPFDGDSPSEVMLRIISRDPVPVGNLCDGVPREFADLIMQLLEKDPDDRPATAREVVRRIERIERGGGAAATERARRPAGRTIDRPGIGGARTTPGGTVTVPVPVVRRSSGARQRLSRPFRWSDRAVLLLGASLVMLGAAFLENLGVMRIWDGGHSPAPAAEAGVAAAGVPIPPTEALTPPAKPGWNAESRAPSRECRPLHPHHPPPPPPWEHPPHHFHP